MTTHILSLEARRELIAARAWSAKFQGEFPEGMVVDGRAIDSLDALETFVSTALHPQLDALQVQWDVAEYEDRRRRWREEERRCEYAALQKLEEER